MFYFCSALNQHVEKTWFEPTKIQLQLHGTLKMVAEHEKIKEIRPYPQERKTNFLNGYFPKEFFLFDSFSSLI